MAKYMIVHSCGHRIEEQLYGLGRAQERGADWLKTQPCRECQQAAEFGAVRQRAVTQELPELVDSPKQIEWAMCIRFQKLAKLDTFFDEVDRKIAATPSAQTEEGYAYMAQLRGWAKLIRQRTAAVWWIDRGYAHARELLREQRDNLASPAST